MLRISFLERKFVPVGVVAVTREGVSVILMTGVERRMVSGLRRAKRQLERDCVPGGI
jgi:hypothetical protein